MRRTCAVLCALAALVPAACRDGAGDGASTSTGPSTSAPAPTEGTRTSADAPAPQIALRGDGLAVVDLGAPPGDALAAVRAELGEPTLDTGWQPSFSTYGTCPGSQIRAVEWDGLVLLFTDEPTEQGEGAHLFSWRLTGSPPALATAEGFGVGATVGDAEDLYPGAVEVVPPEEPFPGFLVVHAVGGEITAYLAGEVVSFLEAGTPCGE